MISGMKVLVSAPRQSMDSLEVAGIRVQVLRLRDGLNLPMDNLGDLDRVILNLDTIVRRRLNSMMVSDLNMFNTKIIDQSSKANDTLRTKNTQQTNHRTIARIKATHHTKATVARNISKAMAISMVECRATSLTEGKNRTKGRITSATRTARTRK